MLQTTLVFEVVVVVLSCPGLVRVLGCVCDCLVDSIARVFFKCVDLFSVCEGLLLYGHAGWFLIKCPRRWVLVENSFPQTSHVSLTLTALDSSAFSCGSGCFTVPKG